jgi:hypothetical protein
MKFSLSDDFVARGKWNEMSEAFQGDSIAVADELMNRLRESGREWFWDFSESS